MNLSVSHSTIYAMLKTRGYTMTIMPEGESKTVTFHSRVSTEPHKLPRLYAKDWTDNSIINDCVQDLLRWSGMRVVATLEYK